MRTVDWITIWVEIVYWNLLRREGTASASNVHRLIDIFIFFFFFSLVQAIVRRDVLGTVDLHPLTQATSIYLIGPTAFNVSLEATVVDYCSSDRNGVNNITVDIISPPSLLNLYNHTHKLNVSKALL